MRSSLQTSLPFSLQVFFCLSPQVRVLLNDRSPHLEKEKVQKQQWKRTQGATENTHNPRASKSFLFVVPSWQIPQFQQFASMPFFSFSGQHIQKCKIGLPNPKMQCIFPTFSKKQKKDVFSNGNGILGIAGGARNGRGLRLAVDPRNGRNDRHQEWQTMPEWQSARNAEDGRKRGARKGRWMDSWEPLLLLTGSFLPFLEPLPILEGHSCDRCHSW